ncbi:energy transducer TonB [Parerythrobacter aestuarii]|uniref:energy transducer TonB n=1 Tax=Parerythrobacter aestuarii TaxID=3020909 RepID=UPI0024DED52A|nr:energy transducer TonB [Parerythrobacter aestuarii]
MGPLLRIPAVATALAGIAVPASALAQEAGSSGRTFETFGNWKAVTSKYECGLVSQETSDGYVFGVMAIGEVEALSVARPRGASRPHPDFSANLWFDGRPVAGQWSFAYDTFSTLDIPPVFAEAFKRGKALEFRVDGETLESFSLTGSAKAYAAFASCKDAIYKGPVVPPVAPPPLRARAPDLAAPLPANRAIAAIQPERWVQTYDYPARALREELEGVVTVRMEVSTSGRATGCTIIRSSGSNLLDERTCVILTRHARFDPPTDTEGQPIEGSWTQSINWQIPQSSIPTPIDNGTVIAPPPDGK